jgi:glycosyltransferase involved in cell wall biosynthesis
VSGSSLVVDETSLRHPCHSPGQSQVLYVTSWFTLKSTFIVRELNEVARTGANICVYSLKRLHRGELDDIEALPYSVQEARNAGQLLRMALLAIKSCRVLLDAVVIVCRENHRSPRVLLKAIYAIWLACSIATDVQARRLGVHRVHAHWATIPTTTAWILSQILGVRFSFTAHAWDIVFENQMLPFKIRAADTVLTCTRYNKSVLGRLAPDRSNRIHVVYHGLSLTQFKYQPGRSEIDVAQVLALGRYVEKKGFIFLLEAIRRLHTAGIKVTCRIFGESGPARRHLMRYVADHSLSDVVSLHGFIPERSVLSEFQSADVFVMPSVVEQNGAVDGIPNVIVEALAVGVPTIATSVAGIPEVIKEGETGLLVPPRDPRALESAIQRLVQDPHLRQRLSRGGRQLVERNFDVVANSANHWRLISGVARS